MLPRSASLAVLLCLVVCPRGWAQEVKDSETTPVTMTAAPEPKPIVDKRFQFSTVFFVAATVFDFETTFRLIDRSGDRLEERNILMRPLVKGGRVPTYAYLSAVNGATVLWSSKLKRDGKRYWWLLPVAAGTAHVVAGLYTKRQGV